MHVTIDLLRFGLGRAQRELGVLWRHLPPARFARALLIADLTTVPAPMARYTEIGCFAVWEDAAARAAFDRSAPLAARWAGAREHLTLALEPVKSHGSWLGGDPIAASGNGRVDGPVVVQTLGRLRPRGVVPFWRTNPAIVRHLNASDGMLWHQGWSDHAFGAGTLSLWRSGKDATRFAYGGDEHRRGITGVRQDDWSVETHFVRHRLLEARGTWRGRALPLPE